MIQAVPDRLDDVLSRIRKAKPAGPHKWVACCPAHDDRERSLSVRVANGRILFKCFAGCDAESICAALNLSLRDLFADNEESTAVHTRDRDDVPAATLEELAAARKLPLDFLQRLGWSQGPTIRIAYKTRDGKLHQTRIRRGHSGSKGVRWEPGGSPIAYEPDGGALARQERELLVCEGETDAVTLLYAGFPALGIPGATLTQTIQAHHLDGIDRVYYVREPDRGGEEFERLVPARLAELGFSGGVYQVRMPDAAKDPSALFARDPEAFPAKLRAALQKARQMGESGGVEWRSAVEIFAPLPPVSWRVRGLQICPGRPSVFCGYGASAKTLSAQALGLACAAGRPVWEHFDTPTLRVRHLDYEQGWYATARRYQRLAYGLRIDPREVAERLHVTVFPRLFLDQEGATDVFTKLVDGADLVILDSFKAATPTRDENDNSIRTCLDVLTHVSEKTGASFLVLHHAGKVAPGERDARAMGRGASAIFDASGSWFNFLAGAEPGDPRTIKHAKQPAEAEGMGVLDFQLDVLDVAAPGQPAAGVKVSYRPMQERDPVAASSARYDAQSAFLVELIDRHPGLSMNELVGRSAIGRNACLALLDTLARRGAVVESEGPRGARLFYPRNHRGSLGGDG